MIVVRPMIDSDIQAIADDVREPDRLELEEGCGQSVASALTIGLRSSVKAHVICWDDVPLAAFGDVSHSPCAGIGIPWLISTNAIEHHPRQFLRACKPLLGFMRVRHPTLLNYVDARNTVAIRWLEWLGFTVGSATPYGPNQLLFRQFQLTREN